MFDSLQQNLSTALNTLRGRGKLSESNMQDGVKAVQRALLEADVNYDVVKSFIERVSEEARGQDVLRTLDPSQQIIGIVHQELINLMGPVDHSFNFSGGVSILMLCGLQGSGKTTTAAKLALHLREQERHPMLVAADLQRPAAIEQLKVLGEQIQVPVYTESIDSNPVTVCQNAVRSASDANVDTIILDTAGRLHVDETLMEELRQIDRKVQPRQIYMVCDAMTGQDAVNSAQAFNDALELDGVILSKLDGDARGGAALSVKAVTGVPIKFVGMGEKLDRLEEFHPERMAGRILGMGDVVTLVEKAQREFDQEKMLEQQEKLKKGRFTLEDFRDQIGQMQKLGSMRDLLSYIPGMGQATQSLGGDMDADGEIRRIEGIINSMTPQERSSPDIIDMNRRRRIAAGSGTNASDVNQLLKQFDTMAGMMKQLSGMGVRQRMRTIQQMGTQGMMNPGSQLQKRKQRSKRLSPRERAKLKKERAKQQRKKKRR